jgi:hypothetical protein
MMLSNDQFMYSLPTMTSSPQKEKEHKHNHLDSSHNAFDKLQNNLKERILVGDEITSLPKYGKIWKYTSSSNVLGNLVGQLGSPTVMLRGENDTKEKAMWMDVKLPGTVINATISVFSKPKVYFAKETRLLTTSLSLKIKLNDHAIKHLSKLFKCSTYNQATHTLNIVGEDLSSGMVELALILHLDEHFLTKYGIKSLIKTYSNFLKSKEYSTDFMADITNYLSQKIN